MLTLALLVLDLLRGSDPSRFQDVACPVLRLPHGYNCGRLGGGSEVKSQAEWLAIRASMCLHKWHCKNKLLKAKRRGGHEREGGSRGTDRCCCTSQ